MTALIHLNSMVHDLVAREFDRVALWLAVRERQGLVRTSVTHTRRWPEVEELRSVAAGSLVERC